MNKMTVREKVLTVILGVLVLFCVYYFAFLIPVTEEMDACINENLTIEDQMVIYDATAEKKRMMEGELKDILEGENKDVKELPAYDNSQNVMKELSALLEKTEQYDTSFSSVEEQDNTVRREVSLSFTCNSYEDAKNILSSISNSDYRCILKDLYLNRQDGENASYRVDVDIVYFEYK